MTYQNVPNIIFLNIKNQFKMFIALFFDNDGETKCLCFNIIANKHLITNTNFDNNNFKKNSSNV